MGGSLWWRDDGKIRGCDVKGERQGQGRSLTEEDGNGLHVIRRRE